jgi:hypothetical protein
MSIRFSRLALDRFSEHSTGAEIETIWSRLVASLERAARAVAAIHASRYVVRAHGLDFIVEDGVVTWVRSAPRR